MCLGRACGSLCERRWYCSVKYTRLCVCMRMLLCYTSIHRKSDKRERTTVCRSTAQEGCCYTVCGGLVYSSRVCFNGDRCAACFFKQWYSSQEWRQTNNKFNNSTAKYRVIHSSADSIVVQYMWIYICVCVKLPPWCYMTPVYDVQHPHTPQGNQYRVLNLMITQRQRY